MWSRVAFLLTGMFLCGCAAQVERQMEQDQEKILADSEQILTSTPECCLHFSGMNFEKLEVNDRVKTIIGPKRLSYGLDGKSDRRLDREQERDRPVILTDGMTYLFPTGKSFFKAFKMPPPDQDYSLNIRSRFIGGWGKAVFRPSLMFLDRDFRVTREIHDLDYRRAQGLAGWYIGSGIAVDRNEEYVIVFMDPSKFRQRMKFTNDATVTSAVVPGGVFFVPVPSRGFTIPFCLEGIVDVEVELR